MDKKNQLVVTFCILYFSSDSCSTCFGQPCMGSWNETIHGRTTYQPDLTTFLQPQHIPTQGYNITQSSAPDDGHMVARNMLSSYQKRNKEYKKWQLVGFSHPHWITIHGQPHIKQFICFDTVCHLHSWNESSTDHKEMSATVWLLHHELLNMFILHTLGIPVFHKLPFAAWVRHVAWIGNKCVKMFVYNKEW